MRETKTMKCLKFNLIFLLLVAVRAEEESPSEDGVNLPKIQDEAEKSSEKRWIQDNQSHEPQSTFLKELPTLNLQSGTKHQESAKEERTFKDFVGYEAIQSILIKALKPKPIVDTAEESEKLAPNEGLKVPVLDLVVKGSETLSRALNTIVDKPKNAITRLSAGATQALNQLGAYLIGL